MRSSPTVLVPLSQGFEEIEAVTIIDVLRRAGITVITASVDNQRNVCGAHQIMIQTDNTLQNVKKDDFDCIALPGGMPGTSNLAESRELADIIDCHKQKHDMIFAAICAAPIVLAKYGILQNKKATCYPGFENKLGGANLRAEEVVVDDFVITSRGPGTAVNFALALVDKLLGSSVAANVKRSMVV